MGPSPLSGAPRSWAKLLGGCVRGTPRVCRPEGPPHGDGAPRWGCGAAQSPCVHAHVCVCACAAPCQRCWSLCLGSEILIWP